MNVWPVPWNNSVLNEANKFWFYALSLSVIGALWEILFAPWPQAGEGRKGSGKKASKKGGGSSKARQTSAVRSVMPLVKRIVVDGCDLLLPGSFLGWVPVGDVGVGLAMVVSTVVASRDIWIKAQ